MNPPLHGKAVIRTCQIIASAMMMGIIIFGGIAIASQLGKPPVGNNNSSMLMVLVAFAVVDLAVRFVYLRVFDQNTAKKIADHASGDFGPEAILATYQTRLIVSLAFLEGVAFFGLVAFMAEGRWEAFGIATFFLLLMAMNFPTENKFREWTRKLTGRTEYQGDE